MNRFYKIVTFILPLLLCIPSLAFDDEATTGTLLWRDFDNVASLKASLPKLSDSQICRKLGKLECQLQQSVRSAIPFEIRSGRPNLPEPGKTKMILFVNKLENSIFSLGDACASSPLDKNKISENLISTLSGITTLYKLIEPNDSRTTSYLRDSFHFTPAEINLVNTAGLSNTIWDGIRRVKRYRASAPTILCENPEQKTAQ